MLKNINKKSIVMMLLTIVLLNMSLTYAEYVTPSDIEGHWTQLHIERLLKEGYIVVLEDGSCKPDEYITFIDFLALVTEVEMGEIGKLYDGMSAEVTDGGIIYRDSIYFRDIEKDEWYESILTRARAHWMIDEGEFTHPEQLINRAEASKILATSARNYRDTRKTKFKDDLEIPEKYGRFVKHVTELGIIKGYGDNTFKPYNTITRGEAFVMVNKLMDYKEGKLKPKKSNKDFTGEFIEPDIEIYHRHEPAISWHFKIQLNNVQDYYQTKDKYRTRVVFINYPELNTYQYPILDRAILRRDEWTDPKDHTDFAYAAIGGKYNTKLDVKLPMVKGMEIEFDIYTENLTTKEVRKQTHTALIRDND